MRTLKKMLLLFLPLAGMLFLPASAIHAGLEEDKAAAEAQIAEFQKKIAAANGNLAKIVSQIEEVQAKISAITVRLNAINGEIQIIEGNIVTKEAEIAQATEQFNKKKEEFYQNLRSKYEEGNVEYTAIILDSVNLTDFINNNEYYRIIKAREEAMIQEIKAQREALEVQKAELEAVRGTLAEKQAQVLQEKAQQDIEKKKLDSQKSYFASLSSEYKSQLAKEQAELASIQAKIAAALAAQQAAGGKVYTGNGVFRWPVPASSRITSDYGYRTSPIFGVSEFHKGIDISAPSGSSVVAAEEGRVLLSYYSSSFGNTVVIDHGSGLLTLYAHLSSRSVSAGQDVSKGQGIGAVGSTGWSTGPHLHFQVTNKGDIFNGVVDPNNYLGYR